MNNKLFYLFSIILICLVQDNTCIAQNVKNMVTEQTYLKITAGAKVAVVRVEENQTAKNFLELLPLSLDMMDIHGREKYSPLPHLLKESTDKKVTYEVGDVSYWPSGPGLAIFYTQDNREISGGIIRIGKIESGKEIFADSNAMLKVKIEIMPEKRL